MSSPASNVKDIMVGLGLGTFATDIFVGAIPDTVGLNSICMGILDSGGYAPTSSSVIEYPTIQILVRGKPGGYEAAYNKAEEVKEALHDLHNESWGDSRYIGIWASSDIVFVEFDDKNRPLFSVNFEIHRTDK